MYKYICTTIYIYVHRNIQTTNSSLPKLQGIFYSMPYLCRAFFQERRAIEEN